VKRILLLLFIALEVLPFTTLAGSGANDSALRAKVTQWMSNTGGLRFLENKGQMMDMQRKPVPNVLYEASGGGMDVYVTTSGLSYVFVKLEKHKKKNSSPIHFKEHNDSIIETYCRADMQLVGATILKENIIQEGESTDRSDYYYGGVCPDGILGVRDYGKVTIKNIYPGIDWVLHTGKHGLKYDFIMHPGADLSLITLHYKWTDKPRLQPDGSVKISTPMGNIIEGTPISYCNGEQVQTNYTIKDSEIHFKVSNYNTTETLLIDPVLVWATYYAGNSGGEDVFSIQDDGKNVWVTGETGATNFPTLNPGGGAYFQGTFAAMYGNIFILQFNIAGVLKWATYYGGSIGEIGYSIYSDGNNVWITGATGSTNFPTYNPGGGAYFQGVLTGNYNAFILQFNTSGVREWATYYGGSAIDPETGNSICSDGTNVWVTGYTTSSNFPTYNPGGGAYFQGALGGQQNAFILQFNTSGVRKWATYYGGNATVYEEAGTSISTDGTNVWVGGYTNSTNFPTLNPGGGAYFQAILPDTNPNAFVLKFNNAGVRKWATYYGGSTGNTAINSVSGDGTNVWVTGSTTSTTLPIYNPGGGAYFQGTLAASASYANAFILKFNTAGVCKWATYYGGNGVGGTNEAGYSIQSDGTNVWVCGTTPSTNFPTFNPGCGFYQDTIGRNIQKSLSLDVFILQFAITGVRKWGTYYGTDVEDDGSYVWSDRNNLFVAGDAINKGYPTINPGGGAYYFDSVVYNGAENIFIGKFIIAGLSVNPVVSICRGSSTILSASGAISYTWTPPTGLSATNIPNPVASPTVTTTYTVKAIDTGVCGGTFIDSVTVIVDTNNPKNISLTKDTFICNGSSITLSAGGATSYTWNTGATTSSISILNDVTTQTYKVSISNGACVKDTDMTVTVISPPKINVSGNTKICQGNSVQLNVSGGNTYSWSSGNTTTTYNTGAINADSTITVTAYNSLGCWHDTTIIIISEPTPNLNACCNAIIVAGNDTTLVAKGNTTKPYQWSPQVTCLNPPLCDSVKASPTLTTTYTVTLTDSAGCQVERTIIIVVETPCINFAIPNVFTPDNAGPLGLNSVFYIKTSGLDSWSIIIYDRWGKEMFSSINPAQYWDGNTEGGGKAPDGVYYYIINASCQNNTFKKDGFVQLIR